jgi:WD40 repeat protein
MLLHAAPWVLWIILISAGCEKFEFQNPVDNNVILEAPSNLSARFIVDSTIELRWKDPNTYSTEARAALSYIVEHGADGISYPDHYVICGDSTVARVSDKFLKLSCHYFRLRASVNKHMTEYSNTVTAEFMFPAPYNLAVTSLSENEARLQWSDTNQFKTQFIIEMTDSTHTFVSVGSVGRDSTGFTFRRPFRSDSEYVFRIAAQSSANTSEYSNLATASFSFAAPSQLTAAIQSETQAKLQWKRNSALGKTFEVEVSENGGLYASIASVGIDTTSLTLTSIFHTLSRYFFRVRAVSDVNTSNCSNIADAQLSFPAPSGLTLVGISEQSVRLQWKGNDSFATGYEVEMSDNGGAYAHVALASKDSSAVSISKVFLRNSLYVFRVRAVTSVNTSGYSNTVMGQPSFPPPSQLALVSLTENAVRVSWWRNDTYATGYEVELSDNGGVFLRIDTAPKDSSSITLSYTFLTTASYAIRVRAVSAFNQSDYSDVIALRLQFPAPLSLSIGGILESGLELRWTSSAGFEEQFSIERKPIGGSYTEVGRIPSTSPLFTDQTVQKTQRYVYRVRALSAHNASIYSQEVTAGYGIQDAVYVRSMSGHTTGVLGLAFPPTGARMISAGSDGRMVVWDLVSGEIVRNITGHTRPVNGVAVSPDGQTVASASGDKTVRLWNINTGAPVDTFKSHVSDVLCVAYSPNGQMIASGGADTKLHVWMPAFNDSEATLSGHTDNINAVAFSPDGSMIASASSDRTIRIWSTSNWMLLRILTGHTDVVKAVAFSSDNQYVISGSYDKKIRVWRVSDGSVVRDFTDDASEINALAVSADGRLIASGAVNNIARVRMRQDGATTKVLVRHSQMVNTVAFSPDATLFATGSNDTSVNLWQIISQWMIMP